MIKQNARHACSNKHAVSHDCILTSIPKHFQVIVTYYFFTGLLGTPLITNNQVYSTTTHEKSHPEGRGYDGGNVLCEAPNCYWKDPCFAGYINLVSSSLRRVVLPNVIIERLAL